MLRRRFYGDPEENADFASAPADIAPSMRPEDHIALPAQDPFGHQSPATAASTDPQPAAAAPSPPPEIATLILPEDGIIDTAPPPPPEIYVPNLAEIGETAINLILAGSPPPYGWVALPADDPALAGIFDDAPDGLLQVLGAWRAAPALVAGLAPINPDQML